MLWHALRSLVPSCTPGWIQPLRERSVLPKNTKQCSRLGLEPRPLVPETSVQATRLPRTPPEVLEEADIVSLNTTCYKWFLNCIRNCHKQSCSLLQAKIVLYNGATEVVSLTFNATGTDKWSWFSQNNLVQSPWTDLKTATNLEAFDIIGSDRSFEISLRYGGCSADYGWFLITRSICPWEIRLPQASILYSKLDTSINWNQYGMENVRNFKCKRRDIFD